MVTSRNADGSQTPNNFVPKPQSKFIDEDEKEVHKD